MAQKDKQNERLIFAEEALIVDAQSLLQDLLDEKGLSRADLARAMGVSRARVTQLFSDECKNFTLRLWARALFAIGEEAIVSYSGAEECLDYYFAGRFEEDEIVTVEKPQKWEELQSQDATCEAIHANDNVFEGLSEMRDANARFEVAA